MSDEKGEIINTREIDQNRMGDLYYSELKEDLIDAGNKRQMTIIVKNDKDEVVEESKIDFSLGEELNLKDVASNVFEEDINETGEKKVTVYTQRN